MIRRRCLPHGKDEDNHSQKEMKDDVVSDAEADQLVGRHDDAHGTAVVVFDGHATTR
jgi:hypothetical protein